MTVKFVVKLKITGQNIEGRSFFALFVGLKIFFWVVKELPSLKLNNFFRYVHEYQKRKDRLLNTGGVSCLSGSPEAPLCDMRDI